jgi:hypothetical protein
MTYALRDSATMLRRNLRHLQRYPSLVLFPVLMPVVFLLLFVYVFGGTLGNGLAGGGGRGDYANFVAPGMLLFAVAGVAPGRQRRPQRLLVLALEVPCERAAHVVLAEPVAMQRHPRDAQRAGELLHRHTLPARLLDGGGRATQNLGIGEGDDDDPMIHGRCSTTQGRNGAGAPRPASRMLTGRCTIVSRSRTADDRHRPSQSVLFGQRAGRRPYRCLAQA